MQVSVIGPAIIDVLAQPFSDEVFKKGTYPMENIRLSFGGNALNEAVILGRFGVETELITKVGADEPGRMILEYAKNAGVNTDRFVFKEDLATGVNVVLIDKGGERFFLTDPNSSLRKLEIGDIEPYIDDMAPFVCFPCMFTSPLLGIDGMTSLFAKIKRTSDRTLFLDMTTAKNGEKIEDMTGLFSYVDYFMPNEKELKTISGTEDIKKAAETLIYYGVGHVIVKRGESDTYVLSKDEEFTVPVYPGAKVVDTTGAGDSFCAGVICGLVNGKNLYDSVRFANATASCTIEAVGATEGISSIDEPMRRYDSRW